MLKTIVQKRKDVHACPARIFTLFNRIDHLRGDRVLLFLVFMHSSNGCGAANGRESIAMGNIVFFCTTVISLDFIHVLQCAWFY